MNWIDTGKNEITSLQQMPNNVYGFIYLIKYTNGSYYIGKKQVKSKKTLPALKNGKIREGAIRIKKLVLNKDTNKKVRTPFDVMYVESNWKEYTGSNETSLEIKEKVILGYAFNKIQLTYYETKNLFDFNVLHSDNCINDNILGKFYRGRV